MSAESKEKVEQRFLKLLVSSYAIPIFMFIFAISPCIGLNYPIYERIFAKIYLIGIGIISGYYGALYGLAFCFLINEIEIHTLSSSDIGVDLLLVLRRLKLAYYAGTSLFAMVMVSHFLCGCWDFLTNKSSYVLLIIQILSQLVVTTLILTISRISNTNKNNPSLHSDMSSSMHHSRIDIRRLKVRKNKLLKFFSINCYYIYIFNFLFFYLFSLFYIFILVIAFSFYFPIEFNILKM